MTALPDDLARALDDALDRVPASRLTPVVERLIGDYRGGPGNVRGGVATAPILRTDDDAAAYAAYRMPATYTAVYDGLSRAAGAVAALAPRTHLDVGGGTGAAVWAAARLWPSLGSATVLEGAEPVIALGRRLVTGAENPAVRSARWERTLLGEGTTLPDADLVTVSYVLGELSEPVRGPLVDEAARRAGTVAVFEPGTPAGYRRVLDARARLLDAGMTVAAPCPHDGTCPVIGDDWCHFAARVDRTSRHRGLKGGTLGHEDEKFAYVVATRGAPAHAGNRVLRHPLQRKGLVTLRLCTGDGAITDRPVPKSRREHYRAARDTGWGDHWPQLDA
ncbi:ribosomal protein RSM22 (predicted rRNA methylase) [Pseudonocardia sediminis]|uniref:Ribosomal protein RSM22 (Predicted rRNA methylase) n=1 Tax=Pseudonocardia sediminis TaxID=1397368 RepID=A0A4Q7UUR5_PSEST|nr:small ribosomal subunit Rsm22 family protein [Pseudonocardia sediminis]RZT84571.1 ribosomal protein RSM22 (predicted rRNA methylase) [Pseudonocardia sediminis]